MRDTASPIARCRFRSRCYVPRRERRGVPPHPVLRRRDFTGPPRIAPLDETANCPADAGMNSGRGAGTDDEVDGEGAHRKHRKCEEQCDRPGQRDRTFPHLSLPGAVHLPVSGRSESFLSIPVVFHYCFKGSPSPAATRCAARSSPGTIEHHKREKGGGASSPTWGDGLHPTPFFVVLRRTVVQRCRKRVLDHLAFF